MAPLTLTVRDETTTGKVLKHLEMQLQAEELSVEDLITARVHQEVREHNARRATTAFSGLVEPSRTERELNATKQRPHRRINAAAQTEVALKAFSRGHILLLVDDKQVDELEERVTLRSESTVTFLKLVPLVGG